MAVRAHKASSELPILITMPFTELQLIPKTPGTTSHSKRKTTLFREVNLKLVTAINKLIIS